MNTTRELLTRLDRSALTQTHMSAAQASPRRKLSQERDEAERKYKKLTSLSKNQQCGLVWEGIRSRRKQSPEWKHDYYRVNNSFGKYEQEELQEFPHNNKKYNIQFLDRTLAGGGLNFTVKDNGFFPKPKDQLYSGHYRPIVKTKREYNEDYELRTSLFGKTWVDEKRDRVMDKYELQTNPFHTDRSNALIATMRSTRRHRFS